MRLIAGAKTRVVHPFDSIAWRSRSSLCGKSLMVRAMDALRWQHATTNGASSHGAASPACLDVLRADQQSPRALLLDTQQSWSAGDSRKARSGSRFSFFFNQLPSSCAVAMGLGTALAQYVIEQMLNSQSHKRP